MPRRYVKPKAWQNMSRVCKECNRIRSRAPRTRRRNTTEVQE